MTLVSISAITEIAPDMRGVRPSPAAEAGLRASMEAVGQLEAVLLRRRPDGEYCLMHGRRRLKVAQALGWAEIEASIREKSAVPDQVVDGAANLVRAAIHPVDQWRHMQAMKALGYGERAAADVLGLTEREARRMLLLAKLHPPLVEAMAGREMPTEGDLRDIANADVALQAEAWKRYAPKRGSIEVDWTGLAGALEAGRMLKADARFGEELAQKHGVTWEEDLFAQPLESGEPELFTRNLAGFRAAQQEWVTTVQVPGLKARGFAAVVGKPDRFGTAKAPPKTERVYPADPDKAPKKFIRQYTVTPDGKVRLEFFKSTAPPAAPAKKGKATPAAEAPPAPAPAAAPASQGESLGGPLTADPAPLPYRTDTGAGGVDLPEERSAPAMTEKGRGEVAALKTAALATFLGEHSASLWRTLAAMVVAMSAQNVRVGRDRFGRADFSDLAEAMLAITGDFGTQQERIMDAAQDALGRMLQASAPDIPGSGDAFDQVARILQMPAPRYDTESVLAQVRGDALRALAPIAGVKATGPVSALRRELVGKLPSWVPEGGACG